MEILDQVRNAANIVEIAGQYTALRQRGKKHVGLCPFHAEKTPSFTIDVSKGAPTTVSAAAPADIFTLVMEKENLDFPGAIAYLAENTTSPPRKEAPLAPKPSSSRNSFGRFWRGNSSSEKASGKQPRGKKPWNTSGAGGCPPLSSRNSPWDTPPIPGTP